MKILHVCVGVLMMLGLGAAAAASLVDSDGDGVPDSQDYCTQTPRGANAWKTGPWAGCSQGQRRDYDIATSILNCESSADRTTSSLHIYDNSSCAPFGYEINQVTGPYVDFERPVAGRRLSTLGNGYLLYREYYCQRTVAALSQVVAHMRASGCDPGGPTYSPYDSSNDDSPTTSGGSSVSSSPSSSSPPTSSGFVSSGGSLYSPTGGGVFVDNHGTLYSPTGGGGFVSSSGTLYSPTGGGGYVDSHGTLYTPTGGGGYVDSHGTVYSPTGGGGFISSGGH